VSALKTTTTTTTGEKNKKKRRISQCWGLGNCKKEIKANVSDGLFWKKRQNADIKKRNSKTKQNGRMRYVFIKHWIDQERRRQTDV
jgi:hypothetical protein